MREGSALVIAGGLREVAASGLANADLVVAADGGLDAAMRLGLRVDVVVGDMDSVSGEALECAREAGAEVVQYPVRKDLTDLELALEYACNRAERVHVVASVGGRLDHAMANLAVLGSSRWASVELTATVDDAAVVVVRGRSVLDAEVGEVVSLLAVGGPAYVKATTGLEYPLRDEVLDPGAARGISNVVVATPVEVEVTDGVLLVIRPGAAASTG